jgi:hypothetical protein
MSGRAGGLKALVRDSTSGYGHTRSQVGGSADVKSCHLYRSSFKLRTNWYNSCSSLDRSLAKAPINGCIFCSLFWYHQLRHMTM